MPSPGPATLELLKGRSVSFSYINHELITPTAAAVFKAFSKEKDFMPPLCIESVGYGAGEASFDNLTNVLRVVVGNTSTRLGCDRVLLVETNIDDVIPLAYEGIYEKLFGLGALDVYMTQIIMKKMRPAVKLSVLCEENLLDSVARLLLSETITSGIRFARFERFILKRKI